MFYRLWLEMVEIHFFPVWTDQSSLSPLKQFLRVPIFQRDLIDFLSKFQ